MPFNNLRKFAISKDAPHQEEYLIRFQVTGPEPVAAVLVYFLRAWLHRPIREIRRSLLDVPLRDLAALVQEELSSRRPLSVNSVAMYLEPLLRRTRQDETTLRDYLLQHRTNLAAMIVTTGRRLRRARFNWKSKATFTQFTNARWNDVLDFIQAKHQVTEEVAKEVRQETFLRVFKKLSKYDARRGSFMAFIFNEVRSVMSNHWRAMRRKNRELSLDAGVDDLPPLEEILGGDGSAIGYDEMEAVSLRLAERLFRLPKEPHYIAMYLGCRLLGLTPLEILRGYAHRPLREFVEDAGYEYANAIPGRVPDEKVMAALAHFRKQLDQPLGTLLHGEKKKKTFRRLLRMRAGDIPVGWYFGGRSHQQKADEITQSCHSVNKQLVTDALRWFPELAARKRKRKRRQPSGK